MNASAAPPHFAGERAERSLETRELVDQNRQLTERNQTLDAELTDARATLESNKRVIDWLNTELSARSLRRGSRAAADAAAARRRRPSLAPHRSLLPRRARNQSNRRNSRIQRPPVRPLSAPRPRVPRVSRLSRPGGGTKLNPKPSLSTPSRAVGPRARTHRERPHSPTPRGALDLRRARARLRPRPFRARARDDRSTTRARRRDGEGRARGMNRRAFVGESNLRRARATMDARRRVEDDGIDGDERASSSSRTRARARAGRGWGTRLRR